MWKLPTKLPPNQNSSATHSWVTTHQLRDVDLARVISECWASSPVFPTDARPPKPPGAPRLFSCSEKGFQITVPRNATAPPLNLDDVRIVSSRGRCKARVRSEDAVTFRFPFTDCGTQSTVRPLSVEVHGLLLVTQCDSAACVFQLAGGILTYWVSVETKPPQRGSIYRDPPLQ